MTNAQRAHSALVVLRAFSESPAGESWKGFPYQQRRDLQKQNIADLLANLMHYCAEERIDFADRLGVAENHFKTETNSLRYTTDPEFIGGILGDICLHCAKLSSAHKHGTLECINPDAKGRKWL